MNDLQTAKNNLAGHTICLCKNGECIYSQSRGIKPMMDFIGSGADLCGYSVADVVVGKAAAMLFVKSGIKSVYAKTLSQGGKAVLEKHGIYCEYGVLTEKIINRAGTDVCPMEKAVGDAEDCEEAYLLLQRRLRELALNG